MVSARVVPGREGRTAASMAKMRDQPKGRPKISEENSPVESVFIGKDAPQ